MPPQGGNKQTFHHALHCIMMTNIDPRQLRLFQPSCSRIWDGPLLKKETEGIPGLGAPAKSSLYVGRSSDEGRKYATAPKTSEEGGGVHRS